MSSPAQAIANRQNAQHSTGPRTATGKKHASLNAFRHGLTSQLIVLPTEDRAYYASFCKEMLADLNPEGAIERVLAQAICDNAWRLERARNMEANILALVTFEELPARIAIIEDAAERQALSEAYAVTRYDGPLRNLQLHEARLQRNQAKSLVEFQALQDRRKAATQERLQEAADFKLHHRCNNIPFDPQALGFVFTETEIDRELKRNFIRRNPSRRLPPVLIATPTAPAGHPATQHAASHA